MSHPLKHPKPQALLKRVAQSFQEGNSHLVRDSNSIFVCGGSTCKSSMRKKFLTYANCELSNFRVFLAEAAQNDYLRNPDPEPFNVAEFEDIMAEVATCVILFPESPGSFAELGYFSRNEHLRKKLLVVNNARLQGQDSFIALGPIELIDKHSSFKPTIQLSNSRSPHFKLIKERLESRISTRTRQRFTSTRYKDLTLQGKFYFLYEIVRIFHCLSIDGVEYAFKSVWGHVKQVELQHLLSILVAAKYIRRVSVDVDYFLANPSVRPFFEFEKIDVDILRLQVLDFYERHFPALADIAKGGSK